MSCLQPEPVVRGRYRARFADCSVDIEAAQALRYRAFRVNGAGSGPARDADDMDARCDHVLVEDVATGALAACFRLMLFPGGTGLSASYAAQFYDLAPLAAYQRPLLELGRFCLDPDCHDPDALRTAWAVLTRQVDRARVGMLFGCTSFTGCAPEPHRDALALLAARHLAPLRWSPGVKAPEVVRFAGIGGIADLKQAMRAMPPLLRTYLAMGGWVSDHAVIDRQMNTLHVFTGVEIAAIPPGRARLLRADAA